MTAIRGESWSEEENELLRKEYSDQRTWDEIQKFFPSRSLSSVRHRGHTLGLTTFRRYNAGRTKVVEPAPAGIGARTHADEPPERLWLDRDRRANEYRDTTAMLMGDPPFSQSALGRQNAQ